MGLMTNGPQNRSTPAQGAYAPFQGKSAFVTGGGTGIGRVTALAFAERGASVAVVGHLAEDVEQTAELIRESGGNAIAIVCDVTRADEVEALSRRLSRRSAGSTSPSTMLG
jgi:NAD(P)-dependent dehydrogenase (short-subunit alcohol dehydrogenase family)